MKVLAKNIALIGIGYWGNNILRNLSDMDLVHTVCDTNISLIKKRQKEYQNLVFTANIKRIWQNDEIKAVIIASPAVTHYMLAKKALECGKDVLVEKPLALNVKEGKNLVSLAKKKKRILQVGHILQYHPAIIKLMNLIKAGKLGKVQYVYSNRLNIGKLRVEENILWSFAPHDISVILMLMGDMPKKISSFGKSYINEGIYDVTLTEMEFANKVMAHIFVSWLHPFKEQKLIVVGSEAMAVFDDLTKEKLFLYSHKIKWSRGKIPVVHKSEKSAVPIKWKEPLREELLHFAYCVAGRKTPKTDGEEGVRVLRVLEKAEKSMFVRR